MNGSSGENLETEDLHYVGQNFIMEFFIMELDNSSLS